MEENPDDEKRRESGYEEKHLNVWGKDRKVREDGNFYAEDYYCVDCYSKDVLKQAKSFWPVIDPDIKSSPRCRECIKEKNLEIMLKIYEDSEENDKNTKNKNNNHQT